MFCLANYTSCYSYSSTLRSYAAATTYCQGLGGYVVAWNRGFEQLLVR
jgi:hypothetical protein